MGISTKLIAAGVVVAIVGGAVWLGYKHYTGMQEEIQRLQVERAELRASNALQKDAIDRQGDALKEWQANQEKLVKQMQDLKDVTERSSKEVKRLNDIFAKHDLGKLSKHKPGLIEKRINSGTAGALRMLECSTGKASSCPEPASSKAKR